MAVRILFAGGEEPALSTMAAALLDKHLTDVLGPEVEEIQVATAGLGVQPGACPSMNAVEVMREMGLDLMPYEPKPLTPDLVDDSDLVLTMSTYEMDGAIKMVPTAVDKVFTLREFAGGRHMIEEVLEAAGIGGGHGVVKAAADRRIGELHDRYLELLGQMKQLDREIRFLQEHLPDISDAAGRTAQDLGEQLAIFDISEPQDHSKEEYRHVRDELELEVKKLVVMLIHDD